MSYGIVFFAGSITGIIISMIDIDNLSSNILAKIGIYLVGYILINLFLVIGERL